MKMPLGIRQKLNERRASDSLRSLSVITSGIDFYSNDYLGIARIHSPSDLSHGATGSRLISGNSEFAETVEAKLAEFFGQETATLFNSGYDANLGFFSAVPQRGDTILYDTLSHASIRDGIRLGLAAAYSFRHNDLEHLKERLKQARGEVYVAAEAVYSMDGDRAPLVELAELCEMYGAFLVVDEAHSGGVAGSKGEGMVSSLGLDEKVFAKIVTFGKAYGSHGAIVLGSQELKTYLINFSRSLIYTTALPPVSQERILFAVNEAATYEKERNQLRQNIELFRRLAKQKGLEILEAQDAIQGIGIAGNSEVKAYAQKLENAGFLVKPILSPTVEKGKERIRICLHSFNTGKEIEALINQLS